MTVDFDYLKRLRQSHPAWRLLAAENAPMICGFLHWAFIQPNVRAQAQPELVAKLEDFLFHLRESYPDAFPKSAQAYLDDWASPRNAFLRKYYPRHDEEPEWDLTPATEKALVWLEGLRDRPFVGTESRLLTVFTLLRELFRATETDSAVRVKELERRRADLDREIEGLRHGQAVVPSLTATQVRERYMEIQETARRLLTDFRQVEANFRDLDRSTREKIAFSDRSKPELLDEIFGEQDAISASDQGLSFNAFWLFLMSPERQEELHAMLKRLAAMPELAGLDQDPLLERFRFHLLGAGEKVQRTAAQLVEQLRRFLESRVWMENRRIADLIRSIERQAGEVRAPPPGQAFVELAGVKAGIELPFTRTLFAPPRNLRLQDEPSLDRAPEPGVAALFDRPYVDPVLLRGRIDDLLRSRRQIALADVLDAFPLEHGMAELVIYLHLATQDNRAMIDEERMQTVPLGGGRTATLPLVIYCR